jgi:hypothetical protein
VLDDAFLNSKTMPTCPAAPPPGGLVQVTVSCAPVQVATVAALVPVDGGAVGADEALVEASEDADEALAADEPPEEVPDAVVLPLPDVLDVHAASAMTAAPVAPARPIRRRILAEFTR